MNNNKSNKTETSVIEVMEVARGHVTCCILGTRPIILQRMSEKAKGELLLPAGRKTAVEKATRLKHDPYQEFQDSPYTLKNDDAPTLLAHRADAFKAALASAALDLPGTRKAQIARLTWVEGDKVPIYGIPQVLVSVVRNSDMNHTPDIRTRCIVPEWACQIEITFVRPLMRMNEVVKLLAAAGLTQGIGDWRPEKGKGTYGQFQIVEATNADWKRIVAKGGRGAQIKAMSDYLPYDSESEEMLTWFDAELKLRRASGKAA
jgi:hypothetical protein